MLPDCLARLAERSFFSPSPGHRGVKKNQENLHFLFNEKGKSILENNLERYLAVIFQ